MWPCVHTQLSSSEDGCVLAAAQNYADMGWTQGQVPRGQCGREEAQTERLLGLSIRLG